MIRRSIASAVGSLFLGSVAACSAAPASDAQSQSNSQLTLDPLTPPCDGFPLTAGPDGTLSVWTPDIPVVGVVLKLAWDDVGNANWVVTDAANTTITKVLEVDAKYSAAFESSVLLYSPGGAACEAYTAIQPGSPCKPGTGSTGGGSCVQFYSKSPQANAPPLLCLPKSIPTVLAPACEAQPQPCRPTTLACGSAMCGSISDGCGNTIKCDQVCGTNQECIDNACVTASCARGYRWCGADGCVRGTVCP